MNGSPSILRRPIFEKSNTEFTNSLRANFEASQQAEGEDGQQVNGSDRKGNHSGPDAVRSSWIQRDDSTVYIPRLDFSVSGLAEERSQYDITVKLFFLPTTRTSERCAHTREAISLVLKELHAPSIDLLIVSFPGISFDADDEDEDESLVDDCAEAQRFEDMVGTWQALEKLHSDKVVAQIGVAEFGDERLKRFLPRTSVRPSVDQINVKDCCVVPKSLILYAKEEKIELLTHNDCTDILPKGTIRQLLGPGENGANLIADGEMEGLKGDIEPQWVVKYTAVVRDRGVIENKGYFAMAEIIP